MVERTRSRASTPSVPVASGFGRYCAQTTPAKRVLHPRNTGYRPDSPAMSATARDGGALEPITSSTYRRAACAAGGDSQGQYAAGRRRAASAAIARPTSADVTNPPAAAPPPARLPAPSAAPRCSPEQWRRCQQHPIGLYARRPNRRDHPDQRKWSSSPRSDDAVGSERSSEIHLTRCHGIAKSGTPGPPPSLKDNSQQRGRGLSEPVRRSGTTAGAADRWRVLALPGPAPPGRPGPSSPRRFRSCRPDHDSQKLRQMRPARVRAAANSQPCATPRRFDWCPRSGQIALGPRRQPREKDTDGWRTVHNAHCSATTSRCRGLGTVPKADWQVRSHRL